MDIAKITGDRSGSRCTCPLIERENQMASVEAFTMWAWQQNYSLVEPDGQARRLIRAVHPALRGRRPGGAHIREEGNQGCCRI